MRQLLVAALAIAAAAGCATTQAVTTPSTHARRHSTKAHTVASAHLPTAAAGSAGTNDGGDEGDDADKELAAIAASEGAASFYHDSLAGRVTANGEKYDPEGATCAHRSLPFGTMLVVEDVATGKKSQCRVNDRGPYVDGRMLDVSRRVARDLGMLDRGVIRVRIRVAKQPTTI